ALRPGLRKIKIERAKCPCDTHSGSDRGQRIEGESQDFHPCQPTQCKRRERRLFLALTDERGNQISKDRLIGASVKRRAELLGSIAVTIQSPDPAPLRHRPQSLSSSYRGCTCPCSGTSAAYRVRD